MSKISAEIVADSSCNGHRITTMKVTMPRIVLAEAKTHRVMKKLDEGFEVYEIPGIGFNDDEMLSRNSASSRAIPFNKMVEMVKTDPFIPIAWQKDHKGMQGTEYYTEREVKEHRLIDRYLQGRNYAVQIATELHREGVTKQLCNRLLEPFMWHTVLVTATELENFFHLRCGIYEVYDQGKLLFKARSRKELLTRLGNPEYFIGKRVEDYTEVDWLKLNKGQAEIHMMALAEAMWDQMQESKPKELLAGQWHIPYESKIDPIQLGNIAVRPVIDEVLSTDPTNYLKVRISTAFCAQTSYTVVGDGEKSMTYENLIDLHNSLLVRPYTNRKGVVFAADDPIHASPAEHCARAMTADEYAGYYKGVSIQDIPTNERHKEKTGFYTQHGWCHNLRGWMSYRSMIPNESKV